MNPFRIEEHPGRLQPFTAWDDRDRNWRGSFVIQFCETHEDALRWISMAMNSDGERRRR